MNRSNASRSNAVPVDGPELNGVKKTSPKGQANKSANAKSVLGRQVGQPEETMSVNSKADSAGSHNGHSHGSHSHVHDDESIRRIVNRLSRIEGHVRGLKRMVQDQENCPDVLIQVAAVRGALDKVARLILDEHLTQCVLRAAEQGNIEAEIEELQAALNRFLP